MWKYELKFMSGSLTTHAPISGHTTRRLETRRKLLAAGTELFAEHGVRSVTSTAIARRAGVATGTFYLHFADKHELFEELVEEALAEIRSQFRVDPGTPRTEADRRAEIDGMLGVVERRRPLVRAVFDRGENTGVADRIQDHLAAGLEAGYERLAANRGLTLHPGAAAQARAAVVVGVIAWWAEDPARATRREVVDLLVAVDPIRMTDTPASATN
jgi:AcrR family transcriptional regulator